MAPTDEEKRKTSDGSTTERPKKRVNKPLIEKRRRERINDCLNQLQNLISQLDKHKVGRPGKLEKADILEMTVEFVKKTRPGLQVQQKDEADIHQQSYMAGFRKCMDEITLFCKDNDVPTELKEALHSQIDLKIRKLKSEEQAVDLTIKNEKKEDKLSQQLQIVANNSPVIQPKCLPHLPSATLVGQNTNFQIIQRQQSTTTGQVTVVCQKEPSTYVLVPTAAFCQPIQIPGASQSFPVFVQNSASNYELKSTTLNRIGNIYPSASAMSTQGQLIMIPSSSLSIPVMNTSSSGIDLSSSCQPTMADTISNFQNFPTSSMKTGSVIYKHLNQSENSQSQNVSISFEDQTDGSTQNENMWRPW